jgi:hypothetical protein
MVTVCGRRRRKVDDRRRCRRRWSKVGLGAVATEVPRPRVHAPAPAFSALPPAVCNLSLTPVCSFPLHLSLLDDFTLTHINHGRLPETHHLAVGDPHLHLCLLCPVFRGCQGPQDHPQGTQAHPLSFSRSQLLTCFQVYFDVTSGDEELGRIVLGLYGKTVPKVATCPASIRWP